MTIYEKPVRLLMKDFVTSQKIDKGQSFSKYQIISWFGDNYPKINPSTISAHLIMMSVNAPSRVHYNLRSNGEDDFFYQIDGNHFRLCAVENDPLPLHSKSHPEIERFNMREESEKRKGVFLKIDVEKNIYNYIYGHDNTQGIKPLERYASFDYCFNYFQSFREQKKIGELESSDHIQESCLQLGFYLASWGMLRGSTFLFSKSVKVYEPLINTIANADTTLWEIDTNCYTPTNIGLILDFRKTIAQILDYGNGPSDILVTKIMLGVFGNVPAFDSYFKRGFGVSTFTRQALEKVAEFYKVNEAIIEKNRLATLDFMTGQPTHRFYPRAKIIDMIFFIEGGKAN